MTEVAKLTPTSASAAFSACSRRSAGEGFKSLLRERLPLALEAAYDLLFKAAAEPTITIAADRKHLGARISITPVLQTWGKP
jgi:hypothetical protein